MVEAKASHIRLPPVTNPRVWLERGTLCSVSAPQLSQRTIWISSRILRRRIWFF